MKLTIVPLLVATLALATPAPTAEDALDARDAAPEAEALPDAIPDAAEAVDASNHLPPSHGGWGGGGGWSCYHASSCGVWTSAKCNQYCYKWGGVYSISKCSHPGWTQCCCKK